MNQPTNSCLDPGLLLIELAVLQRYLETESPSPYTLAVAVAEMIGRTTGQANLRSSLSSAAFTSLELLGDGVGQRREHQLLLSHAHLDLAIWPVSEITGRCQRTLNQFSSSSKVSFFNILPFYPAHAWIESITPDLLAIQQQVEAGRFRKLWVVMGGAGT